MSEGIDPRPLLGEFATDLWLPRYRTGEVAPWRLSVLPVRAGRGYWGTLYRTEGAVMLFGPHEDTGAAWMSIVPMEIESQAIGIAAAYGHTVVAGLGMGWAAANTALNPGVTQVTVIERDADVIALNARLGWQAQLPGDAHAKLSIVQDDALTWTPDRPVDCLQADIWARFVEPQKWDDVRHMHANTGAASVYFWGQELELWRLACRAAGGVPARLSRAMLDAAVTSTGLPLVIPPDADFPERIVAAAQWWTPRDDDWYR